MQNYIDCVASYKKYSSYYGKSCIFASRLHQIFYKILLLYACMTYQIDYSDFITLTLRLLRVRVAILSTFHTAATIYIVIVMRALYCVTITTYNRQKVSQFTKEIKHD